MRFMVSVWNCYEWRKKNYLLFRLSHLYAVLCTILLTAFSLPAASAADEKPAIVIPNQIVRVGLFPQEGIHNYQNGKPVSGYGYDYLQHLRQYAPWQYQYFGQNWDWPGTMQQLLDGKIDLMSDVRKTPEREKLLAFSKLPMGQSSTILTVKSGDTRYRIGDYVHWDGIRIGILRSTTMRDVMGRFAKQHGFSYTEVLYDGISEMLRDLQNGKKLDAAVSNNLRILHQEWMLEQLDVTFFYFAVRKDNAELLAQLDAAMAQQIMDDPSLRDKMWKKYFAQTMANDVQFFEAETNFIRQMREHGQRFTAVLNPDRHPLSYFADGKQCGLIKEIADEIVRRTGLNMDFLPVTTPEEYQEACKNQEVDFVFDQKHRLDEGEQKGLVLSRPYISLSAVLLKNRAAGAVPRKYVLVEGYRIAEPLKMRLPADVEIQTCKTSAEAIQLVTSGKCDATCLHSVAAEFAVRNDSKDILEISLLPKLNIDLCVGTRDNRNPLLASIMNKSVASLGDDLIMEMVRKHEIPNVPVFSFALLAHRHPLMTFGVPFLLLLILCVFLIRIQKQHRNAYRLGVVFKNLPMHYFFADAQGKMLQYDLGNTSDQPKYKTLDDVKDEAMRLTIRKAVADALASGKPQEISYFDAGKKRSSIIAPVSESVWGRPAVIGVSRDISELSRSRDEAWKNAEFFRLTLRSIGDGVITTDGKGNIIMLNPIAEKMMGVKLADVLGKPHADYFTIVSADDGSALESPVLRTLRTGNVVELANHTDLLSSDGKTRWHISDSSSPIIDTAGKVIGAILVFRDVTEEYNHRAEMAADLANWKAVAKIAGIYHFTLDPVTGKVDGNSPFDEVWPITENGHPVLPEKWVYPEDLPEWKKQYASVCSGNRHEAVISYRAMDHGKMRYFRGYMRGSKEPNGKITGMLQELTHFVEAEQKQNALKDLWTVCLKNMPLIFFIKSIDDDFRYVQCNENYTKFIGKNIDEIIGHTDMEFLPRKEDLVHIREHDMEVASSKSAIAHTETLMNGNGDVCHYQTLKFCANGLDGKRVLICMALNITEDYNRQQKLNEMLEDWENVANVANIGSYRLDSDMNPLTATRGMAQFWPLGKDGKPLTPEEYLVPEDVAEYKRIYSSVFSGEREQASMLCHVPTENGMRYLQLFIRRNPEKTNVVSGLLQDVTLVIREQKKREALLAMWKNVVNTLPALFFVKNADDAFRYLQVNRNFCDLLNMSPQEIIGRKESELLPNAEDSIRNETEDRLTMESGTRQDFVEQLHVKDGELRHFQTVKIPSVDEEGRRILICMSQDITETQTLSEVRKIITSAFESLFSSDNLEEDMRVIMKNICDFLGFARSYIGCIDEQKNEMRIFSVYRPANTRPIFDLNTFRIEKANTLPWYIKLKESVRDDAFHFNFADEYDRELAMHHVPSLLENAEKYDIRGIHVNYISIKNKPWGCIGFVISGRPVKKLSRNEDMLLKYIAHIVSLAITRKQVMNQLQDALNNALAADKAKTYFLSSMSHEIRTPLNAVIGFTDLLKDQNLDQEIRDDYLNSVSDSSNALLTLLNDILELSKLTSSKSPIPHPVMTDIQSFVGEMDTMFRSVAQQKHLTLDISADGVPKLFVDQPRLRQILFNLVGNAIKYTRTGGVTAKIGFEQKNADFGTLTIQVTDTGIGIADEDREKMFEPFVQMSRMRGTTSSGSGTGLGLAIVKKIVEQAGGKLTLESTIGYGSTFTIELPKIALHTIVQSEKSHALISDFMDNSKMKNGKTEKVPRVLIVDDSEMALDILSRMMDWIHVPYQSTTSAQKALELLEKESFDVLITDILMPEMNGVELTKKVRNNPAWSAMRVVAMSTENESIMYDRKLFNKVMLKPIVRNALRDAIFEKTQA